MRQVRSLVAEELSEYDVHFAVNGAAADDAEEDEQGADEEGGEDEQSRKPQQKRDSHAAYCLHERAGEANDHLRWCYLLQVHNLLLCKVLYQC